MKTWGALLISLALVSCGSKTKTVSVECVVDDNCPSGQICEGGTCISRDSMGCESVVGGAAVLAVSPYSANFGAVQGATTKTLTLRNIGNCTLMVFEAKLGKGDQSPFTCPGCDKSQYPFELFRGREKTLDVAIDPKDVGSFQDELILLSDDTEYHELKVPLHATFNGVPKLLVDPNPLDFGYQAQGGQREHIIRLANVGTGIAKFHITSIHLDQGADNFGITAGQPTEPVDLDPVGVNSKAGIDLKIAYHPRDVADHTADLVIEADPATNTVHVPIKGSSNTPPVIGVSPTLIDFGTVDIGSNAKPQDLVITNNGGSALKVTPTFSQTTSQDFKISPPTFPDIEPGKYLTVQVLASPSVQGKITGNLLLNNNDPATGGTYSIPVQVEGHKPADAAVIKIEMNVASGDSGMFGDDLRKADLSVESPYGMVSDRKHPTPTESQFGKFGSATWLALGPKETPQRVVVIFDRQQLTDGDGEYRVMVQYTEDCSMLPTGLLAGILGVSIEALAAYMSSGAVLVNGQNVSDVVSKSCFSHSGTTAAVSLTVDGAAVDQRSVSLGQKGDFQYITLVKSGGASTPYFKFK